MSLRPGQGEIRHEKLVYETMKRLGWHRPENALKLGKDYRKRGWAKGEAWRETVWVYDEDQKMFKELGPQRLRLLGRGPLLSPKPSPFVRCLGSLRDKRAGEPGLSPLREVY